MRLTRQASENSVMHETMDTLGADLRDAAEDMAVLASQIQSLKRAATSAAVDGSRPSSAVPTPSADVAIWAALKKAVTHLEAKHAEVEEAVSELDTRVEDRMEVNAQVIVRVSHAVVAKGPGTQILSLVITGMHPCRHQVERIMHPRMRAPAMGSCSN